PMYDVEGIGFSAVDQGYRRAAEAKRTMGAIAAQAAIREMLTNTLRYVRQRDTYVATTYFRNASQMARVLEAASGGTSVSLRPVIVPGAGTQYEVATRNSKPLYTVSVSFSDDDPWWKTPADCGDFCNTNFFVFATTGALDANLMRDDSGATSLYGRSRDY